MDRLIHQQGDRPALNKVGQQSSNGQGQASTNEVILISNRIEDWYWLHTLLTTLQFTFPNAYCRVS